MSQQVILFGAGKNAPHVLKTISSDFVPVCFADSDKAKQGVPFRDTEFLVFSPEEAKVRYPNASWLVTAANVNLRQSMAESLVKKGLANNKDLVGLSTRWSCQLIETTMSPFNGQDVMVCRGGRFVNTEKMPTCKWMEADETVDSFLELREDMINELNTGFEKSACFGCVLLKHSFWNDEYKIRDLVLCTTKKSICNFSCSYCYAGKFGDSAYQVDNNACSFRELVAALEQRQLISPDWTDIHFSDGEITIDPKQNELYTLANKYKSLFYSNGSVFSEEIHALLRSKKAILCTSMDAGTNATFQKIKQVDAFDMVCQNLYHYAALGGNGQIWLKYIFLPGINDKESDFEGFINICNTINPAIVILSTDCTDGDSTAVQRDMPPEVIDKLFILVNKLMESGHTLSMEENITFSRAERCRIYELAEKLNANYLHRLLSILNLDQQDMNSSEELRGVVR